MNFFISLKVKLIIYTLFFIISSTIAMGLITNQYIYDYSFENIKKQLRKTLFDISSVLKHEEDSLIKSTNIISDNESLISSLANMKKHNIDKNRKKILDILVSESKHFEEDHTAIYDTNNNLVAFIDRELEYPTQGFVSYKDNKKVYYIKRIASQGPYTLLQLPNHFSNEFYKNKSTPNDPKTLYRDSDGKLNINSYKQLLHTSPNKKSELVGYVKSNKNIYIKELRKNIFNEKLKINYHFSSSEKFKSEVQKYKNIPLIFSKESLSGTCIEDDEQLFTTAVKIPIENGSLLLTVSIQRDELEISLTENKKRLMYITATIILITIILSLLVLHNIINIPIKQLIKGIDIISKGDYTKKINIKQNDEFRIISDKFNEMAHKISKREFDLDIMAHQDSLTKIPNRAMFNERLGKALSRAARLNTKVAVFFIDLDDFKIINDTLGHDYGDELLVAVSNNLIKVMRNNDLIARIGGDEFNVLIEDLESIVVAQEIAQKILHQTTLPLNINNTVINVSASVGISIYPLDANDTTTILKNADLAMYHAKESGKNNYRFFNNELSASLNKRSKILHELRHALKHDEFELYYQPKFTLKDGVIKSAEALIRWNNRKLGFLTPDMFIPLAEESTEIIGIGRWVIKKACEDFVSWRNMGLNIDQISINVSNIQFDKDDIFAALKDTIYTTNIDPTSIEIEITESYVHENSEKSIDILNKIRGLGVGLAMDDFGTGFSSMGYLKKLPLTRLKIDKSFIDDIPHNNDDVEITKIIIALAKVMNLSITAEGIETIEQLHFLQKLECDEGQGYLCSKPIPNDKFIDFLKSGGKCCI